MDHYRRLLAGLAADPQARIGALPMLDADERRTLQLHGRGRALPPPELTTVSAMVDAQARRTPDAPAVVFDGRTLTYAELTPREPAGAPPAWRWACAPKSLVGVWMERSLDMVVALLGILKAGGAYVPLDPAFPTRPTRVHARGRRARRGRHARSAGCGHARPRDPRAVRMDADAAAIAALPATPPAVDQAARISPTSSTRRARPAGRRACEVDARAPWSTSCASMRARAGPRRPATSAGGDDAVVRHRRAGAVPAADRPARTVVLASRDDGARRRSARARCSTQRAGDGDAGHAGHLAAAARERAGRARPASRCCAAARRCRATWPTACWRARRRAVEHVRPDRDDDLVDARAAIEPARGRRSPSAGRSPTPRLRARRARGSRRPSACAGELCIGGDGRRARLPQPARADRRALRPAIRSATRARSAALPHRRPGALPPRRPARVPRPPRPPGQAPRLPHRARRDRGRARRRMPAVRRVRGGRARGQSPGDQRLVAYVVTAEAHAVRRRRGCASTLRAHAARVHGAAAFVVARRAAAHAERQGRPQGAAGRPTAAGREPRDAASRRSR